MLPDNTFPVTGGIMQTEEVVPRAQSTGIVSSLTDTLNYQYPLHLLQHLQYQLPELVHMAVKQEPQDDDERARCVINNRFSSNEALNSQQAESSSASTPTEVAHHVHHGHDGMTVHQQLQQPTGESTLGQTNQDSINRSRPSRGRRKSRWKLKFHHQALPPEYLDHYEAALAQEALNTSPTQGYNPNAPSPAPTTSTSTSPSTPSPNADVQGWLQRITAVQQEISPTNSIENNNSSQSNYRRSVITSSANNYTINHQPSPRPPMKYSDLPYMGEITLDNSKPRRGRKPKKADICHLIYKNYGTILPGTPGHEERGKDIQERLENNREQSPQINFQRSDIQNRISSLLEKRLTQESKKGNIILDENKEQNEPLNLCIKDLNQLKIRLLRKHGNIYESGHVKSESSSDNEDIECVDVKNTKKINLINSNKLPECINNNNIAINNNNNITNINNNNTKNINQNDKNGQNSNGLVYWPNGGVFIHPMALQSQLMYYQKMSKDDNKNQASPVDTTTSTKESKIIPKTVYSSMVDSKSPIASPSPVSVTVTPPSISPRPKRIAQTNQSTNQSTTTTTAQPTKRKRSAIFIPPMPTENNNNPATEVSICKFKFTGGAKPSLQEKKSLSVDSGGNFRYYSGTGDKSMRGYEFFPRETLQQPAGQATSSAGAFLSAAGERIPPPQLSSSSLSSSSSSCQRVIVADDGRRKRKTRKSLQREKLEQTFKEKGFLIQTQQLESAEGATYCKFRQLRKFTRYLFRSWKDYLPGNVGDLNHNPDDEQTIIAEVDGEQSPSPISNSDLVVMSNVIDENQTLPIA
ncbi:putative uncharacterized protein DDB_G0277255 isoform X2 [Aphidius gifuensis]|uniref:putative uncharacterized protein DDB_G0277255 isoform X2 n=1 Tax=Aphidius gifuensis TaxID=684658 RepID=UPI001CDCA80B|nr:putative uncharacterized protein DDB_G0277255 isoform X2 [Aphidius gifuensis]